MAHLEDWSGYAPSKDGVASAFDGTATTKTCLFMALSEALYKPAPIERRAKPD
jgi:hypothetical protein